MAVSACGLVLDNDALVDRARQSIADADYRTASIDLKAVLQSEPENGPVRALLGSLYLKTADWQSAEKELRRAIEIGVSRDELVADLAESLLGQGAFDLAIEELAAADRPVSAMSTRELLLLANAYLGLERPLEARTVFTRVLEIEADNASAYLGLARVELVQAQFEQAMQYIDRAIEVEPESPQGWLTRGRLLLQSRNPVAARDDLEQALLRASEQGDVRTMEACFAGLADIHLLNDDLDAAAEVESRLNDLSPGSVIARYTSARVAFAANRVDDAVALLQGVLKDVPDFRQAHLLFGAINRALGNYAQAEMYLTSVVNEWPQNIEARKLLADVRLRLRKPSEASAVLDSLLEQVSPDKDLLALAGLAQIQVGEIEQGLDLFRASAEASDTNLQRRLDLAAILLTVGKTAEANALLAEIADTGSQSQRAVMLQAIAIRQTSDAAASVDFLRPIVEKHGDYATAAVLLAKLLTEIGEYEESRTALRRVLETDNENVDALLAMARLEAAEQEFAGARSRLSRAKAIEPGSTAVILALSDVESAAGDLATAASWLDRATVDGGRDNGTRLELATRYISLHQYRKARKLAEAAVAADPDDARALNILGVTQMTTASYAAAQENFARAFELDPDVVAYGFNLARARFLVGSSDSAISTLQTLSERFPRHVYTAVALADYFVKSGDPDGAIRLATRLQAYDDTIAEGLALEGDVLAALGRRPEAIAKYERAMLVDGRHEFALKIYRLKTETGMAQPFEALRKYVQSRPDNVSARMHLAESLQLAGLLDEAKGHYMEVLAANPDNVVALNNLAWLLMESDSPEAESTAAAAYRLLPDNTSIADTYGWALFKLGKSEEALQVLQKAVTSNTSNGNLLYHLAAVFADTGKQGHAQKLLERALQSNAEFSNRDAAEQLLAQLRQG